MNKLELIPQSIDGLAIIRHSSIADGRGSFRRLFCRGSLCSLLEEKTVTQINHSYTKVEGTLRGLHFQFPPHSEAKVVTCIRGAVWDVALDLRRGSPTFLQYQGVMLSEAGDRSYFIPEGFAHGFQTLAPDSELLYLHTADFEPDSEGTVNATDSMLGIDWPRPIADRSVRDAEAPMLDLNFEGVSLQ
jgi:dTDP-4-dehydrorhamnose 3,5-epimerase